MKKTKNHPKIAKSPKAVKSTKASPKTQKVAVKSKGPIKVKQKVAPKLKLQAPQKVEKTVTKKVQIEAKQAPAKQPAQEKVLKMPKVQTAKAQISSDKSSTVKVQAQGNARVIEPLSWDAEKPKLNMMLTNKVTRKDKDKEETEVKSYSIKSRYTVGDRVMHTDFGKGLVRDLIGDFKIRVAFRDFEKVLVHGIN